MRIICEADPRNWVETDKKGWSLNDAIRWQVAVAKGPSLVDGELSAAEKYYREFITDACLVDLENKEYQGLDKIFDSDLGDLDAAVEYFWAQIPVIVYNARFSLGKSVKLV